MVDACFLQEIILRVQGFGMLEMVGWNFIFWWSGNGFGDVVVMLEHLCENVLEERKVSDKVMAIV